MSHSFRLVNGTPVKVLPEGKCGKSAIFWLIKASQFHWKFEVYLFCLFFFLIIFWQPGLKIIFYFTLISTVTGYSSYYVSNILFITNTKTGKRTSSSTAHISVKPADSESCWLPKISNALRSVFFGWARVLRLSPQKGMPECDTTSGWEWEPPALPHLCLESGNSFPGSLHEALLQWIDRSLQECRLWFLSAEHKLPLILTSIPIKDYLL